MNDRVTPMTDVFISYKREDEVQVARIVEGLRGAGLNVWWDRDIAPDAPWEATIEAALLGAKVAIVAWSQASVVSENVRAEARRARAQGKLLQIFLDTTEPPLFFGERQGVNLSAWSGDASDPRFHALTSAARALIAGERPPAGVGFTPRRRTPWAIASALATLAATVLAFVANVGGARDTLCSVPSLSRACSTLGLIADAPPTVTEILAQQRAALLAQLPGQWGLVGRPDEPSCRRTFRLAVARDGDDDVVTLTDGDYVSPLRVVAALDGVIHVRALPPSEKVGEASELRPDADRLNWHFADGRSADYVRCGD